MLPSVSGALLSVELFTVSGALLSGCDELLSVLVTLVSGTEEASDVLSAPSPAQPVNISATAVISAVNLFFI